MADLASLRIAVDSRSVNEGAAALNNLSRTADGAEAAAKGVEIAYNNTGRAVDRLTASNARLAAAFATSNKPLIDATKYVNQLEYELERVGKSALQLKVLEIKMAAAAAPTQELSREIRSLGAELIKAERNSNDMIGNDSRGIVGVGNNSKLAGHHMANLSYQLQDVVVGFASGQKPMTIFMQQGSQISQIMMQAGVGIGTVAKEMGGAVFNFLKAHPIMVALAATAATLYAAFEIFTAEISKTAKLDQYAKSLGLTDDEMKKLGPTSITAMDAIKGIWRTINEALNLSEVFNTVAKWFSDLFSRALNWAKESATNIYGSLAAAFDSVVYIWRNFPRIIGDLVISAANAAIGGVEGLINRAIDAMNGLAAKANSVLKLVNLPTIPELDDVQIGRIANQYAGAATSIADTYSSSFAKRTAQVANTLRDVGDAFSNNIIAAAKDRLDASAAGIISQRAKDGASGAAGDAGKEAGEAMSDKFLEALDKGFGEAIADFRKKYVNVGVYANLGIDVDADFEKIVDEINAARDKAHSEQQRILKENVEFAVKGAQEIGDLIGGSFGQGVKDLSTVLAREFPALMADLGGAFSGFANSINGVLASLGTSFSQLGAQGSIGSIGAAMTGGSRTGGSIGGAIGGTIGGAIGGPIGQVAGSILGGIIGGLFKKTKSASATISAAAGKLDVASVVGNNADFKKTANTLAGAVITGLNKAASALGAEITDSIKISIGQRKDKFVVDTLGLGRNKGSGTVSFATEAEAITYAIDNAIRAGVLGGIRAGTQRLLTGFGDLEDRLQKAVDFESVFRALKEQADPFTTAMANLDTRFQALILTFQDAGATAEEWVDLERYYQIEREKAIKEGNAKAIEAVNEARDQLTEAYNRESDAILTTLERFKALTTDLESFRLSLAEQLMTAEQIYRAAKANFDEIAKLAAEGNERAITDLISVSQKYLDASKNFLTPDEYNREIENVMKAVDLAIVATKSMEDYAQLQLDALNNSVDGLLTVNESVLSVRDAITALAEAQAKVQTAPATTLVFAPRAAEAFDLGNMTADQWQRWIGSGGFSFPGFADGGYHSGGLRIVGENGPELEATGPSRIYNANTTASILSGGGGVEQQIANLRDEMRASLYAIAKNTGKTSDQLQRWDGDGMPAVRDWTV